MVDYRENVYARRGVDGRSHIPALPFWVAIIRVFQLILTVLVMILAAYALHVLGDFDWLTGDAGLNAAYDFSFFNFAWTIIYLAYIFVAPLWFPQLYLYWAHLGLEIVTVIFWLVDFALLAHAAAAWNSVSNAYSQVNQAIGGDINQIPGFNETGIDPYAFGVALLPHSSSAIGCTKGAAAVGAINWLLFVITLIAFGYYLHLHRVANGGGGFPGFGTRAAPPAGDVEAAQAHEKTNPAAPVELRNVDNQPVPPPPAT